MSARSRQLAAHLRRLADDDLNDLLVDLPTDRFAALVDAALSYPVSPAGLGVRLVSAAPAEGWTVLAAYVRALDDLELNDLLVELPVDRFDALLEAAFPTAGAAA